jgi:hypothetical protein
MPINGFYPAPSRTGSIEFPREHSQGRYRRCDPEARPTVQRYVDKPLAAQIGTALVLAGDLRFFVSAGTPLRGNPDPNDLAIQQ